jgi:hypothetical protein
MNGPEAYNLLVRELASIRALSYDELTQLIGSSPQRVIIGVDSVRYAIQTYVKWRKEAGGDILVEGWVAVDDCGPLLRLDERFTVRNPATS